MTGHRSACLRLRGIRTTRLERDRDTVPGSAGSLLNGGGTTQHDHIGQ